MPLVVGNSINSTPNDIWGSATAFTLLNMDNPSAVDTIITKVEVLMQNNYSNGNAYVATYYGSGTSWRARSYATVGVLYGGTNVFTGLNIECKVGDLIGVYWTPATYLTYIRTSRGISGGGYATCGGNSCNQIGSLYSYTIREPVGFLLLSGFSADGKKINGVTNTKWNGITIAKFNGI